MINVYAWPPVGVVGHEWTEEAPVQRSRSLLTGKDYMSAYSRTRRVVTLNVSALANGRNGAGYMEMLKRFLDGGIHAVRLYSYPVNWWLDGQAQQEAGVVMDPINWYQPPDPISWTEDPDALIWFTGTTAETSTIGTYYGRPAITCTGFPPSTLLGRPGDLVRIREDLSDIEGITVRLVAPARSGSTGNVRLLVDELPANGGLITVGSADTAVFRPQGMPRSVQPLSGDWQYQWSFREVFSDEVGGFTEINPWRVPE